MEGRRQAALRFWDLKDDTVEFLGFSFCCIYSRLGVKEACKPEMPMGTDQEKEKCQQEAAPFSQRIKKGSTQQCRNLLANILWPCSCRGRGGAPPCYCQLDPPCHVGPLLLLGEGESLPTPWGLHWHHGDGGGCSSPADENWSPSSLLCFLIFPRRDVRAPPSQPSKSASLDSLFGLCWYSAG